MRRASLLRSLLPVLLGACTETVRRSPAPPGPVEGKVLARFRVESAGRTIGHLVELAFPAPGLSRYFRVEDASSKDLGFVTENGVAYRFEPHRADPIHVSTDTMERNLRALFGVEGPLALVRVEPASRPSD
ncbi:MAG TPA: hypothetical protein VFI25_15040 [Planctomycetota bacterium]|jgi:hypothetical protein|nr:hypothetical protein [Planctomycetota bacterium]